MKVGCLVKYRWASDMFHLYDRPGDPSAMNVNLRIPGNSVGVILETVTAAPLDSRSPKPYPWHKVLFPSGTGWVLSFDLDWAQ